MKWPFGIQCFKFSILLLVSLPCERVFADVLHEICGPSSSTEEARRQIEKQLVLTAKIKANVERADLGRFIILERASQSVLNSIENNGIGHFETMRQYQNLIVAYRFSKDLLKKISGTLVNPWVRELLEINNAIIKERGMDDSPYTQITANVFSQMKELIESLKNKNIDPKLRGVLEDLVPDLGQTIAIAKEGDRPQTFAAGINIYRKILLLYNDFDDVPASNDAFEIVVNIQGLNEYYREFSQAN